MTRNWDILKNINDWVKSSDAKAAAILAFCGASIAFLGAHVIELRTLISVHSRTASGVVLYASLLIYGLSLVGSVACAFMSVWPRTKNGDTRSLLFFGHIGDDFKSGKEYAEKLKSLDDGALDDEVAKQAWMNSRVAKAKFNWISWALKLLACASMFWVTSVAIWFILG